MKKNKLNRLLKFGFLLFGAYFFIVACQKDDNLNQYGTDHLNAIKSNIKISNITTFDIQDNNKLLEKINGSKSIKNNQISNRGIYSETYDFSINTDYGIYIENGDYHSYTFQVFREIDNGFIENLLLSHQHDGSYKAILLKYDLTEQQIDELDNNLELTQDVVISSIQELDGNFTDYTQTDKVIYNDGCNILEQFEYLTWQGQTWEFVQGSTCYHPGECEVNYTYDLTQCDNSGGGGTPTGTGNPSNGHQSGAGGTTTGNNTTSTVVCKINCLEAFDDGTPNTPCQELQEVSNTPSKLIDLKNSTGLNKEVGFTRTDSIIGSPNSTIEYQDLIWNESMQQLVDNTLSGQLYSDYGHTHYDLENQLSVFSLSDIYTIFSLLQGVNISNEEFNVFLVTEHDTKYALKFKNLQGVQDFVNFGNIWLTDWGVDTTAIPNYINKTEKIKNEYHRKIKSKNSNEKNEKNFAKFLDKYNMGIDLYKANDNFSQWKKVNPDGTTTTCP